MLDGVEMGVCVLLVSLFVTSSRCCSFLFSSLPLFVAHFSLLVSCSPFFCPSVLIESSLVLYRS
jgi:hypothetical protein